MPMRKNALPGVADQDGPPRSRPRGRRTGRRVLPAVLGSLLLLAAGALGLSVTGGSAAAAVPGPPAGWTTVFSDDFNGASGSGLNRANWLYDTGTGYGYPGAATMWGTGEIETATDSTTNVYQDGSGHLVIKPVKDAAGHWTSGRIETQRTDFAAPAGGQLEISACSSSPPRPMASATGPRSGRWAPTRARSARPTGQVSASWTSWRTSTP